MKLFIKLAGVISVVISISLLGVFKTHSKKAYILKLQKIVAALYRAESILRLKGDSRDKILLSAFSGIEGFELSGGSARLLDKAIPQKQLELLNIFFCEFGSGDIPLERQRIKRVLYEIETALEQAKTTYAGSHKVWQTVSVCAGLALGIMLI